MRRHDTGHVTTMARNSMAKGKKLLAAVTATVISFPIPPPSPRPYQMPLPPPQKQELPQEQDRDLLSSKMNPLKVIEPSMESGPLESTEAMMNRLAILQAQLNKERARLEKRLQRGQ